MAAVAAGVMEVRRRGGGGEVSSCGGVVDWASGGGVDCRVAAVVLVVSGTRG
jgi:hypothetical protein